MSNHIDVMKKAIEFKKPDYLPMEILDVPGIYNAYYTMDPNTVELIPGTENFDSISVFGAAWFPKEVGKNKKNEIIRIDEYGVESVVPKEETSAYIITNSPLNGKNSISGYKFPDPNWGNFFFEDLTKVVKEKYSDRFLNCYIDPAAFLIASFLMGTEYLYLKLGDNIKFVVEVIEMLFEYQKKLLPKYKAAGAHMVTYLDEFASNMGMMFSPDIWRKHFKHFYVDMFKSIHTAGLYTGLGLDGNFDAIIEDILNMEIDVLECYDTRSFGIDRLEKKVKGKTCIKCGVDMSITLDVGTTDEVMQDAIEKVERLNSPEGGYISEVLKWHRPEYPEKNYLAAVKAFNKYRKI